MRRLNSSTYVPAEPQPGELDPLMEHALTQTLERDVLVPILQNMAGGLGVFVVIVAVWLGLIDYGYSHAMINTVLWTALYCGLAAFGLALAWRAFRDEWKEALYHWSRGWAEGRTHKELQELHAEVDWLRTENRQQAAQLAQYVRNVRSSVGGDELPQPLPRVMQDQYAEPLRCALALCRYQDTHGKMSRDAVIASGAMDRNQWEAAKRLLVDSGVPVNSGAIAMTPALAMSKVRDFVEKQRAMPGDFVAPFER